MNSKQFPLLDNLGRFLDEKADQLRAAKDSITASFDEKRTLCEVLEDELSSDEFSRVTHYLSVAKANIPCNSIKDALLAFNWAKTTEGRQYWAGVYAKYAE